MSKKIVSIIIFPGSNCDRDLKVAIENHMDVNVNYVWHDDSVIQKCEMIFIPGGFSYGDYLRSGALATKSNSIKEVIRLANKGVPIVGICNGFQILTECGLLNGTLINNQNQLFVCKESFLKIEYANLIFTKSFQKNIVQFPIAHAQGNFYTSENSLKELEDNNQIIFRYCSKNGKINKKNNPNGSLKNIAGICNKEKNILGLMPHPERSINTFECQDGILFFNGLKTII